MSGQRTVRLRTDRAAWTSAPFADDAEARLHAEHVSTLAHACAATGRFFPFEAVTGLVQVRGRDVIAVEVRAWSDAPPMSHRAGTTAAPAAVTINYHGPDDDSGTDFLRHMAGLPGSTR